jgi:hypothetical protein
MPTSTSLGDLNTSVSQSRRTIDVEKTEIVSSGHRQNRGCNTTLIMVCLFLISAGAIIGFWALASESEAGSGPASLV